MTPLFLVQPDGWLVAYWLTYFVSLGGVNVVVVYGALVLRGPARSVTHDHLTAALAVGVGRRSHRPVPHRAVARRSIRHRCGGTGDRHILAAPGIAIAQGPQTS